jgi:Ethylbenzene dehydrogenase
MRLQTGLVLGVAIAGAGCGGGQGPHEAATEVVAVRRASIAMDPGSVEWGPVPAYRAALQVQDMVEPRLLQPSTPEVTVQAMTDGTRVAFRLQWADATKNDLPASGLFSDACAVQLPGTTTPDVPAPQMGEPGRAVEITYWRAFWQAAVDGRPDNINAIFPGAAIDHYPFEAASLPMGSPEQQAMALRYAPARAVGNHMAGPRSKPVEDLIGEGPSTLRPTQGTRSDGRGTRAGDGWSVVMSRPVPADLAPGSRTQVAFAVWDGEQQEVGARKMRTVWVPLLMAGAR